MPTLPYNDRSLRNAPAINGKRTKYSIEGKRGLFLIVSVVNEQPSRTWYVRYQTGKGSSRRQAMTLIGDFGHYSPAQAWDRASDIIRNAHSAAPKLDTGGVEAGSKTFDAVYREWMDRPDRRRSLRPRSREEYERIYRRHVQPHFGDTLIADVAKPQIADAVEKVRRQLTADGNRGLQATKALSLIFSVCEHALNKDYIARNPARGLTAPVPHENPNGKQHRPPTNDELKRLWHAAPQHMPAQFAHAFKLTVLIGKRISEVVGIEKHEIRDNGTTLFIPASREGNKAREDQMVPLPSLAAKILAEAAAASGQSPFVFQARSIVHKATGRSALSAAFRELSDAAQVAAAVRFHDLRGLINDQMSALGVPQEYRSHILHHTGDTRASLANSTYSTYDFLPEKRRALELWETRLLEIVEGRPASGARW